MSEVSWDSRKSNSRRRGERDRNSGGSVETESLSGTAMMGEGKQEHRVGPRSQHARHREKMALGTCHAGGAWWRVKVAKRKSHQVAKSFNQFG